MGSARRPEDDTPTMETRSFTDDGGRRWSGSVISGRFAGGEKRAEVIFVCEDSPGETKRAAWLDRPPAEAAKAWKAMDERQVLSLFRDSGPA
jgi:hypothetical protein